MAETFGQFKGRVAKHPLGAGVDRDTLGGFVNQTIEEICRKFPWSRLTRRSTLQTVAQYLTGTVSIAGGATAGTGQSTVFTAQMTGRKIRIAGLLPPYTFTRVSATSFTIDRPYEGSEDVVAGGYIIWQPIYELPATLESIQGLTNVTLGFDLQEESADWLEENAPSRYWMDSPRRYVPTADSPNGLPQIELWPGPILAEGMPMRWRAKPPLFDISDTADQAAVDVLEFPDWFSAPAVWAGTLGSLADLKGMAAARQQWLSVYELRVGEMQREDARRMPPTRFQEGDRYTQHRRQRANWRDGDEFYNWNPATNTQGV